MQPQPHRESTAHHHNEKHRDDDDFQQARALYRDVMTPVERDQLVGNIVAHASDGVSPELQKRVGTYWTNVDASLGAKVAAGLRGSDAAADARAA